MTDSNIFEKIRSNPEYNPSNSWNWFQNNARKIATGIGNQKLLGDNRQIQSNRFLPGQMIQFFYSAKGKDKLPYWDSFPLVLPFAKNATHFTGLNFHYLHPRLRLLLLSKLMGYVTDHNLTVRTRFKLSWSLLRNASKFPQVKPCVKQYILNRVKSRYLIIDPHDWPIACVLPSEGFKKARPEAVFRDSQSMINDRNKGHGR